MRRGITILEVLFSMGVVAIGLLGVMAVVPVGLNLVGRGTVADVSSRLGQSAMREFETRGMARADQWAYYHPQGAWRRVTWAPGADGFWGTPNDDDGDPANNPGNIEEAGWFAPSGGQLVPADQLIDRPIPGVSFCIDPRLLASMSLPPAVNSNRLNFERLGVNDPNGNEFPYRRIRVSGQERPPLKMWRVSLLSNNPFAAPAAPQMGKAQADEIFMLDDDLLFDIPEEVNDAPDPLFTWAAGADGSWGVDGVNDDGQGLTDDVAEAGWPGSDDIPIQRQFEGQYSWMATVVPKRDQVGVISDQYILSIVIFHGRDPLLEMNTANERLAFIPAAGFHSLGVAGGDVTMQAYRRSPMNPTYSPESELEVSAGDWVLLAAPIQHPSLGPVPYFRWYRVSSAGDIREEPDPALGAPFIVRDLTLQGPDWPLATLVPFTPADPQSPPDVTRVTLVSNVVAVYERTFTIETD